MKHKPTILMIDDDPGICNLAEAVGDLLGYQVTIRDNGAEGLKSLREHDYDVILCDLYMPVMDGRQFLEALQQDAPEFKDRIIFISGGSAEADMAAFLKKHLTLQKPFGFQELKQTIEQVFSRQENLR